MLRRLAIFVTVLAVLGTTAAVGPERRRRPGAGRCPPDRGAPHRAQPGPPAPRRRHRPAGRRLGGRHPVARPRRATSSTPGRACSRSRTTGSPSPTPSTDTGRRVHLDLLSMPRDVAGKPIDPTEWNRNDGFSPSTPILTYVPGLDLARHLGQRRRPLADLARSLRRRRADRPARRRPPAAPPVLVRARPAPRHHRRRPPPHHPAGRAADRGPPLHRRPAPPPRDRRRRPSPRPPAFRAYRDGTPRPAGGARATSSSAGPTSSSCSASSRPPASTATTCSSRGTSPSPARATSPSGCCASATTPSPRLGDTDLADRMVAGRAPTLRDHQGRGPRRRGHACAASRAPSPCPNYLTPQVEVLPEPARDRPRRPSATSSTQVPDEVMDALDPVTDARARSTSLDVLTSDLSVPGSRFNTTTPPTGCPTVDPLQPTVDVPFECEISRSVARTAPSHPMLYGHGLLGIARRGRAAAAPPGSASGASRRAPSTGGACRIADLPNVAADASSTCQQLRRASIDRTQQGFLNFLYLGRALAHPRRARRRTRRSRTPTADPLVRSRRARLRRQQPGRDHGRRAHRARPRLRPRRARRAGHGLLDAAQPQRRLGGRVRASSTRPPTPTRSTSSSATR